MPVAAPPPTTFEGRLGGIAANNRVIVVLSAVADGVDDNRRAVAIQQSTAPVMGANVIEIPEFDQSYIGKTHDPDTGEWHAPTPQPEPPEPRHITKRAFRSRFTKAERAAIEWAAVDRPELSDPQRMQAAALRSDLKDQEQAKFIDLDDPDIAEGVQTLEALGLLQPGRASQIISAVIEAGELP